MTIALFQHSILAEQLAAGISRLKVVVSTFPPIVPSTSDPYQYGNDCQLITADTVSVKLKIVKKTEIYCQNPLNHISAYIIYHVSYIVEQLIFQGGGRYELRRKHRDACNPGADTLFYWTIWD